MEMSKNEHSQKSKSDNFNNYWNNELVLIRI